MGGANEPKGEIKTFQDLVAWQEAHRLVLEIYRVTGQFPKEELYGLVSQMRRAAVSITSNIAEGFGRYSYRERVRFYMMSRGSLSEVFDQLIISKDLGYLSEEEFSKLEIQIDLTQKLLQGLINKTCKLAG